MHGFTPSASRLHTQVCGHPWRNGRPRGGVRWCGAGLCGSGGPEGGRWGSRERRASVCPSPAVSLWGSRPLEWLATKRHKSRDWGPHSKSDFLSLVCLEIQPVVSRLEVPVGVSWPVVVAPIFPIHSVVIALIYMKVVAGLAFFYFSTAHSHSCGTGLEKAFQC